MDEINYRRFFDINELAAIRIEDPRVFDATHRVIFDLLKRIPRCGLRSRPSRRPLHPVPLFPATPGTLPVRPPRTSSGRQAAHPSRQGRGPLHPRRPPTPRPAPPPSTSSPKKSSAKTNPSPATGWSTAPPATTSSTPATASSSPRPGHRTARRASTRTSPAAPPISPPWSAAANKSSCNPRWPARSTPSATSSTASPNATAATATSPSATSDSPSASSSPAWRSIAATPRPTATVTDRDRQFIEAACEEAKLINPRTSESIFDFIRDIVLLRNLDQFPDADRPQHPRLGLRFQQVTGPIMAKGIEDTAFYVYNQLISLNEVGGHPDRLSMHLEDFHASQRRPRGRLARTSMLAHHHPRHQTRRGRPRPHQRPRRTGRRMGRRIRRLARN